MNNIEYKGKKLRVFGVGRFILCFCGNERWVFPYELKQGKGKYCSRSCSNKANAYKLSISRIGEGNPIYKHGLFSVKDKKGSKRKVLDKIKNCELCGVEGIISSISLIVHHKDWNNKNNNMNNLIVLCRKCHYFEHIQYRDKKGGVAL